MLLLFKQVALFCNSHLKITHLKKNLCNPSQKCESTKWFAHPHLITKTMELIGLLLYIKKLALFYFLDQTTQISMPYMCLTCHTCVIHFTTYPVTMLTKIVQASPQKSRRFSRNIKSPLNLSTCIHFTKDTILQCV